MNQISSISMLLLAIPVLLFASCKKDEDSLSDLPDENEHDIFFQGKINGENFEPDGVFWICEAYHSQYMIDPETSPTEPVGFMFRATDCSTYEKLLIKKKINIGEGVFEECSPFISNEHIDGEPVVLYPGTNESASCLYSKDSIEAAACQNIRLEIIEFSDENPDYYYLEAQFDATMLDTINNVTVEISDVHFGTRIDRN